MKSQEYTVQRFDADEGKVFDWKEPRFLEDEDGSKIQEHLYVKTLFIGINDNIANYVEIEKPVEE